MLNWYKEWPEPEKECHYWVYGNLYKDIKKKELAICKAVKVSNGFVYICNGAFFYKSEAGDVVWMKIKTPELPVE